jgi:hypothetical protein
MVGMHYVFSYNGFAIYKTLKIIETLQNLKKNKTTNSRIFDQLYVYSWLTISVETFNFSHP